MTATLTSGTYKVFMLYANDADNWSGNPWVSDGNVQLTGAQRGNLSDLVQKGLLTVEDSYGQKYVQFTEAGKAYAEENGINTRYWA